MAKEVGKTLATEKAPSSMDYFYFWTSSDQILNPFDVVRVEHLKESVTFGVVEEITHITDSASFMTDYISNDFGNLDVESPTMRVGMNYVKARVIDNSRGIYNPVLDGRKVTLATVDEIIRALGLASVKNPIPCGYVEMYSGMDENDRIRLPVNFDSRYLIGPEGAHLNISGISGLAAKTSYAMFLMKAIQEEEMRPPVKNNQGGVAFVLFNVKGCDLLAIDETNSFETKEEEERTRILWKELNVEPEPFKHVHYYYPYATSNSGSTYLEPERVKENLNRNKASLFQYVYEEDKENLDLMFASVDDSTQTMDAILNMIMTGQGKFGKIKGWKNFLDEVSNMAQSVGGGSKEITVQSWRKFARILNRTVKNNPLFGFRGHGVVRLKDELSNIRRNEVHVIDIARLDDVMQTFVFGDVIRALYEKQLGQNNSEENEAAPSKIIVFVDELNKYASSDTPKSSPILRQVLDIAERGRSLGIVMFGAEQFKSAVHDRVTGNCSTLVYGRTNEIELAKSEYKFISQVYKNMMPRLKQGEYIVQNPIFRSLLKINVPKPIYYQFK